MSLILMNFKCTFWPCRRWPPRKDLVNPLNSVTEGVSYSGKILQTIITQPRLLDEHNHPTSYTRFLTFMELLKPWIIFQIWLLWVIIMQFEKGRIWSKGSKCLFEFWGVVSAKKMDKKWRETGVTKSLIFRFFGTFFI